MINIFHKLPFRDYTAVLYISISKGINIQDTEIHSKRSNRSELISDLWLIIIKIAALTDKFVQFTVFPQDSCLFRIPHSSRCLKVKIWKSSQIEIIKKDRAIDFLQIFDGTSKRATLRVTKTISARSRNILSRNFNLKHSN